MGVKQYDSFIDSPEFSRLELMNGNSFGSRNSLIFMEVKVKVGWVIKPCPGWTVELPPVLAHILLNSKTITEQVESIRYKFLT